MNLGSTFYVYEFQLLIGKFSSCWLSTSPHLEGTVPLLFSVQAPEWKSWGTGQLCILLQEKTGQGTGSWGGERNWMWVCRGFTHSLSEPNLQGSARELRTAGREGAGEFLCAACYVLGHRTQMYFSITQLPSEARLLIQALTPFLHKSSHVLWSWFGWFPSLHHARTSLFEPVSIPKSRCLECIAGQTPKTALNKLGWALRAT